jgi:predicted transcriptional regulator
MKQILVELDDLVAEQLERVAPARSRKRSEFVRRAIQEALWALDERRTGEAYRAAPDDEAAWIGAEAWEPEPYAAPPKPRARRRS